MCQLVTCLLLYLTLFLSARGQYQGSIRLWLNGATSPSYTYGRVQIYYNGQWGDICGHVTDSPFHQEEADVVCRNLGYIGAYSFTRAANDNYGTTNSLTLLYDLSCPTNTDYLVIWSCSFSTVPDLSCSANDNVGVNCHPTRIWFDPYPGMIRLTGGQYPNEGRVEVYCNGKWGAICGGTLSINYDARTICRQLGYKYSPNVTTIARIPSERQWFNDLSCSSSQSCINLCNGCPSNYSTVNCSSNTDAYIYCATDNLGSSTNLATCDSRSYPRGDGAVRLLRNGVSSLDYNSGRVQVYYKRKWGNICRRVSFSMTAANVICHQLGFIGAVSWSYAAIDSYGVDGSVTNFDDISCSTSGLSVLQQCVFSTVINTPCTDNDDISVNCSTTRLTDNPYPGMVRLINGEFVNEGRVEVYCNGEWGTVCSNNFGSTDADTICQQLGYDSVFSSSNLPQMPGNALMPIWYDNTACSTSDACMTECNPCPIASSVICSHDNDVTVQCYVSSSLSKLTQTLDRCQATGTGVSVSGSIILSRNGVVSNEFNSGRVVIRYGSQWGNICRYASFTLTAGNVICHQLGYSGASSWSYHQVDNFGLDSRSAVLDDISCSSSYFLTLLQCSFSSSINNLCSDNEDISVTCYQSRIWDNPYSGMVRLVNGVFANEGRIEVYCNGQWGTVCDNTFGASDAIAVCKQLGYSTYNRYEYQINPGNTSQPIWLNSLLCSSGDTCISDCQVCPASSTSACNHNEDVTIRCTITSSSSAPGFLNSCSGTLLGIPQSGAIILTRNGTNSKSYTSGRVVMYGVGSSTSSSRFWGNICRYSSFSMTEADVICHQLTYSGASSWSYTEQDLFGIDFRPALLDDVSCSNSQYQMIFQCTVSRIISSSCTDNNDISVTCYSTRIWNNPYDGMVRLTGGSYVNEGLIEVYCNGRWGTVCDDSFGSYEAIATCKQLGYITYYRYDHLSIRGNTSQSIWLDDLDCNSGDSCLTTCQRCPGSEDHNCGHNEDVTITCYSASTTGSSNIIRSCSYTIDRTGTIVGATIGSVVGFVIIVIVVVLFIRDQHKKGKINLPQNPFRNVRNPFRNIRNPFRNVGRTWTPSDRPSSTTTTNHPPISLATLDTPPAPSTTAQEPPPSFNPTIPAPPPYNPALYTPTPSTVPYPESDMVDKENKELGFRTKEPPPYDPSWAYPPPL